MPTGVPTAAGVIRENGALWEERHRADGDRQVYSASPQALRLRRRSKRACRNNPRATPDKA